MCFQITQGTAQIEREICAFYGSEYEDSEFTVHIRNALSPNSLEFINCTTRLNNTLNSLYPHTIFIYSQWFSQRIPIISLCNIHQLFFPTEFQCSLRGMNCIFL